MKDLMIGIWRISAIDGCEFSVSRKKPEAWVTVIWENVGRSESYPNVEVALYELPAVLGSNLLAELPTTPERDEGSADGASDWLYVRPDDFLADLVKAGAELSGDVPEPEPCPDKLLGPWEKEHVQFDKCPTCAAPLVIDVEDKVGSVCWAEGCKHFPCKGWSLMCCKHGREKALTLVRIAAMLMGNHGHG